MKLYIVEKLNVVSLNSFGEQNYFGVNFLLGRQLNSTFSHNLKYITF